MSGYVKNQSLPVEAGVSGKGLAYHMHAAFLLGFILSIHLAPFAVI